MAISTFYTLNTTNRNSIRTFVDIVDTIDTVDTVDIVDIVDTADIVDTLYLREEELPVLLGDDGLHQLGVGGVGCPPRPHQLHLQQGIVGYNWHRFDNLRI